MKLRATTDVTVSGIDYGKGDVFEALPEQAIDLIRLGYAEEVIPAEGDPPAEPPEGSTGK